MASPDSPRPSGASALLKRFVDVVVAGFGIVLLSPVFAVVALLVKLDSSGPVLYRASRTGVGGVPFNMLKFRTMFVGAVSPRKGLTTGLNDPRVTRIGRILRQWKLDELPQLLNIVLGEMSLVGPRPEMPYYTDQYVGEELLILTVRPGITDFSSVHFSNLHEVVGADDADAAFERDVLPVKNRLRVRYVKEQSFFVDIRLLLQTAWILGSRPFRVRKAASSQGAEKFPR